MPAPSRARARKSPLYWAFYAAAGLAGLYIAWAMVLFFAQPSMVFPRDIPRAAAGLTTPPNVTELRLGVGAGEAVAWLLPPTSRPAASPESAGSPRTPLAVWFHGNAEVIDQLLLADEIRHLQALGFAVLLPEYRGYGRAGRLGESPSQEGIASDCDALIALALARPELDGRLLYLGRSLGGGVACAVAERRPPDGLVLISTFTSIASFAGGYGLPQWLVRYPFRSDQTLAKLDRPVLILHGDADTIVPVEHGRALARIAKRATYVEQAGAGHLDFPTNPAQYRKAVEALARAAGLLDPIPPPAPPRSP